ncbi:MULTISPECIES: MarR family winged helix-turn-helix transcriptional regulator [Staphylococcus]|jgi:DNA-binding MarR family transcriptional regulator|uniref:MarR family transcriptional regulator n=1 Tax=Staphylococcus nepalensis TaxID=214473 RepID=A0A291JHL1_9STAP|nr:MULTISPECIES: MarR family transcriptional regulator [Staphylococcus]VDG65693.1 MarR-family transcriptional regulator [Lacrimispora indolis]ATH58897.1 hypothetical protein BJD96_00335 [Staphylococcus nepalensis]ATH63987.1 hypothetical protein BJG89_00680 [Staphylococcus nepalensis]MBO1206197.1 MarR family transcriptional regulator [Staphylococcus nepalensis]MBO1212170.1 MarR family transcriptional regulator [Staphylococcus nepalensis]
MDSYKKDFEERNRKLKEFQDLFENIFIYMKKQEDLFPKTPYNLSASHILILTYLNKVGNCTVSDITNYLGISSGGGTVLTNNLLKHNLINHYRSNKDKRVVLLSLTSQGEEIVEQIIKQRSTTFVGMLENLDETEIEQILDVFRKLNHNF